MVSSLSMSAQTDALRATNFNIKKGIALEGYDPVSYFGKEPLEGKASYQFAYRGITYRFATSDNLAKFKASPEKYEPGFGGWCAYAMGESGEKVKIDPETYKIIDGKLYLFYNFWGNNTLGDWNKNENVLKAQGDLNWKKFIP
jgi:YHS domain-containing protein